MPEIHGIVEAGGVVVKIGAQRWKVNVALGDAVDPNRSRADPIEIDHIDVDGPADKIRIRAKTASPELVPKHDVGRVRCVAPKRCSDQRHIENIEKFRRCEKSVEPLRLTIVQKIHVAETVACYRHKGSRLNLPIAKVRIRCAPCVQDARRIDASQHHQLILICERKRPQEHCGSDTEDRGVRPDADRKTRDRDQNRETISTQQTNGMVNVGYHAFHQRQYSSLKAGTVEKETRGRGR